jgi:hypothetical protein
MIGKAKLDLQLFEGASSMNSREITLHEICQAYHKQHICGSFLEQTVDNKHFPPAKLLQKEGTLMSKIPGTCI